MVKHCFHDKQYKHQLKLIYLHLLYSELYFTLLNYYCFIHALASTIWLDGVPDQGDADV